MGLTKLAVSLLMLVALTNTWARSISGHRREMIVYENTKERDNSINHYSNKSDRKKIFVNNSEEENEPYDVNFVRRYARREAEKCIRNSSGINGKRRRSLHGSEDKIGILINARKLEKMLEKAILKIITGDLSTADILLLKSFNYSIEEVMAIRERELREKFFFSKSPEIESNIFYDEKMNNDLIDGQQSLTESPRSNQMKNYDDNISKKKPKILTTMPSVSLNKKKSTNEDFDFDAYNRQAIYDYENGGNNMSRQLDLDPITLSIDYENRSGDNTDGPDVDYDIHRNFDRAKEPHVVFKIRYDDSELNSISNERVVNQPTRKRTDRPVTKNHYDNNRKLKNTSISIVPSTNDFSSSSEISTIPANNGNETFQPSMVDTHSSILVAYPLDHFITSHNDLNANKSLIDQMKTNKMDRNNNDSFDSTKTSVIAQNSESMTKKSVILEKNNVDGDYSTKNETFDNWKRKSIYEGLEWVEDDVYRVIPEAVDSLNYYDSGVNEMENDSIENSRSNETRSFEIERRNDDNDDNGNDTIGYQNENSESEVQTEVDDGYSTMRNSLNVNLSTYQQLALAHRRDGNITSPIHSQGQKAIEDIKLKVLAMTGRFNLSSSVNQVQRERLTMLSPICKTPRNTDAEAWSDPFLMNMNFQLNLTSSDHVVAAKVRIYTLPQNNITVSTDRATEEEDEEEKKIRISIYFYTRSLKKHRSKKRLIDSVVISLTTQGSHWALDVRQALRFWRQNLRNSHSINNNHGLVIQVEDQDGRLLKPSQYIQQDSCHTSEINEDDKISESLHSLFKPVLVMFVS